MKNKISIILPVITVLALVSLFYKIAYAQTSSENSATPEVFSEPGAKLLITEVNLKNKERDWIEIYYESPSHKPFNLNNFQFQDDGVFKKISGDYWIGSNEYHVLEFKNAGPDSQQNRLLTTARTGLTATTEQIMIKDPGGKIIDALCWSSATPTVDETKDMEELFQNENWVSADPSSCFPSAKISTNQSLIRIGFTDTDSMNDWTATDDLTPGKSNDAVTVIRPAATETATTGTAATQASTQNTGAAVLSETTVLDETAPTGSANAATPSKTITPQTAPSSSSSKKSTAKKTAAPKKTSATKTSSPAKKTTAKKTSVKKYTNGDLSSDIIISEIFPRAAKDDRNNEWIELTNTGEAEVNLGNWQLDDQDGGSKPYTLPDTLTMAPQSSMIIKAPESKLSLSNSKDQVRLFDRSGTLLQSVEFEEAPKEQSYALVTVIRESNAAAVSQESGNAAGKIWMWENRPTPGEPNPDYLELSGKIIREATFGENYTFVMKDGNGRDITVLFNEALIAGPMAKATFTAGTGIKILGIQTGEEPFSIELKKYEVTATAENPDEPSSPWMLMGLLPPGGAGFWYLLKKIKKIYGKI